LVEPPHPIAAVPTIASINTSIADAGLDAQARASVCLYHRNHTMINSIAKTEGTDKRFQGVLSREEGAGGISIPLAVVLTLIDTSVGLVCVTVTAEPGPAHVALAGAPVQVTVIMSWSAAEPPTSES
jgi:hypothetical protein